MEDVKWLEVTLDTTEAELDARSRHSMRVYA